MKTAPFAAGAIAACAVLALAGAAFAGALVSIGQKNFAFSTARVVVKKGSVLNFTNGDPTAHNILITGAGLNIDSGLQQAGVAFKAPMTKPGEYKVICGIHPKMKMTVVVE